MFLETAAKGRTISTHRKKAIIFSQGDVADAVFYIKKGKEIQRVIRDEPAFSQMFMSHILARNVRVEEDLLDQLFNSTEKRLARLLLLLANFGKEGRPEPLIAKISQETLAEMIGTTRSRVGHFMNKFRKSGFN